MQQASTQPTSPSRNPLPSLPPPTPTPKFSLPSKKIDLDMYQRIREEGLNHSHVMDFSTALVDVIGGITGDEHAQ